MSISTPYLISAQTEKLAQILGDTEEGLTGSQIGQLHSQARIKDVDANNTKWKRLYNAFSNCQNKAKNSTCVFNFIHYIVVFLNIAFLNIYEVQFHKYYLPI